MTIGSTTQKPQGLPTATPAASPTATPATPRSTAEIAATAAPGAEASAQVALSSTATTLLSDAQGAAAEFDSAKVERISRAIEQGEFKIDAGAIADKLIANAAELLNKTPSKS